MSVKSNIIEFANITIDILLLTFTDTDTVKC